MPGNMEVKKCGPGQQGDMVLYPAGISPSSVLLSLSLIIVIHFMCRGLQAVCPEPSIPTLPPGLQEVRQGKYCYLT